MKTKVRFLYRNHRGETALRTVLPTGIRFDKTEWHPEPCWLLSGLDVDRGGKLRDFALTACLGVFEEVP